MSRTLAITMGDPAGIGPEIIVKACRRLAPRIEAGELGLLIVGHRSALAAARAVLGDTAEIAEVAEDADWPPLAFLAAGEERMAVRCGEVSAEAGRFAGSGVRQRTIAISIAGSRDLTIVVGAVSVPD